MAQHAALRWLTLQLRGAHFQRPTGQHCGQTLGTHALGHAANKQRLCGLCHLPDLVLMLAAQLRTQRMETRELREIFIVAVAQLAARRSHNPKVVSPILTRRICSPLSGCAHIPSTRSGVQEGHRYLKSKPCY